MKQTAAAVDRGWLLASATPPAPMFQLLRCPSRHWGTTCGDKAKFGLRASEIVAVVDVLAGAGMLGCLKLLHFHAGSQVRPLFAVQPAREAPCAGPNARHLRGLWQLQCFFPRKNCYAPGSTNMLSSRLRVNRCKALMSCKAVA